MARYYYRPPPFVAVPEIVSFGLAAGGLAGLLSFALAPMSAGWILAMTVGFGAGGGLAAWRLVRLRRLVICSLEGDFLLIADRVAWHGGSNTVRSVRGCDIQEVRRLVFPGSIGAVVVVLRAHGSHWLFAGARTDELFEDIRRLLSRSELPA